MKIKDIEIDMWHYKTGEPRTISLYQAKTIPAHSMCDECFVCKRGSEGKPT